VGLTSPVFPAQKKAPLYPEVTGGTHQPGVPGLNAAAWSGSGGCRGHGRMGRDVETATVPTQLLWSSTPNPSPDRQPGHPLLRKQALEHLL